MITEDYVSFETAKLLKEKGFDEYCYGYYYTSKYMSYGDIKQRNLELFPDSYAAPTLQMAMKWLREVHNIAICICAYYPVDSYELSYRNNKPYWKIRIMNHTFSRDYDSFNTFEEACEAAIKYCLENLIRYGIYQ